MNGEQAIFDKTKEQLEAAEEARNTERLVPNIGCPWLGTLENEIDDLRAKIVDLKAELATALELVEDAGSSSEAEKVLGEERTEQ